MVIEIVTTIVQSITAMVAGSAQAISEGATALLFNVSEQGEVTGISTAGSVLFVLTGIGFAVGLMGLIFALFTRR